MIHFAPLVALVLASSPPEVSKSPSPVAAKPAAPATAAPAAERALEALARAYRKELVYLEGQKRALVERKARLEAAATGALDPAERALMDEALALELQADRLEDELARDAARLDAKRDGADVADVVEGQVRAALGDAPDAADARLDALLPRAVRAAADKARVRREDAGFFDESGKKLEGTVIHVGAIAAFGVSDRTAGPLMPAGGGALKLHRVDDRARALLTDARPDRLPLFVFESTDKAVVEQAEKSPLEIVEAGGAIAWVIAGLGAFAGLLVLFRLLSLVVLGASRRRTITEVVVLMEKRLLDDARARAARHGGPIGRVLAAAVKASTLPRAERDDRIDEVLLETSAPIDRFGTIILVIAAVAPLLGLLGTVTGMIATFDTITEFGTGDPRMLSGGISEALITTELGLLVAIPALLLGNLLAAWGDGIHKDLERGVLAISNRADELARAPTSTPGATVDSTPPTMAPVQGGDEPVWGLA